MFLQLIANHAHPQENPVRILNDVILDFSPNVRIGVEYWFLKKVVCVSLDILSVVVLQSDPLVSGYADVVKFIYRSTSEEDSDDASLASRV